MRRSWHAQKECKYTDANGQSIPAPNGVFPTSQNNTSPELYPSLLIDTDNDFQHHLDYVHGTLVLPPGAAVGPSVVPSADTSYILAQPRKRTRQEVRANSNMTRSNDGESLLTMKRQQLINKDSLVTGPSNVVTRELVNCRPLQYSAPCFVLNNFFIQCSLRIATRIV